MARREQAVGYPFGRLSYRVSPERLLMAGLDVLFVANLVPAEGTSLPVVSIGIILWGLHMGMTQGLLSAIVAESAPADLRGHRLRIPEPGLWHCHAVRERHRWLAVGSHRRGGDVRDGRVLLRCRVGGDGLPPSRLIPVVAERLVRPRRSGLGLVTAE